MSTSDPPVSRYGRTDVLAAVAIVLAAHVGAWSVLQLPIPRPGGGELPSAALLYVWFGAVVGAVLWAHGLSPLRSFLTAYLAMGAAAAVTLAYVSLVAFPDGYVKVGSRIFASLAVLVASNVIAGFIGLLAGARLDLGRALAGTVVAMVAAPGIAVVLLPFVLVANLMWSALTRSAT